MASAAGLRRGAYHFVYWCRPAREQAAWFLANVPNDPLALPPVLDVEWNELSRTCPGHLPREKALAEMQIILDAMEQAYGRKPVIYTSVDFHRDVLQGEFTNYPMWVRSVKNLPDGEIRRAALAFLAAHSAGRRAGHPRLCRPQRLLRQRLRLADLAPGNPAGLDQASRSATGWRQEPIEEASVLIVQARARLQNRAGSTASPSIRVS